MAALESEQTGVRPGAPWLARQAGAALRRTHLSVATLESCTGGLLATLLTGNDRAGYFLGGAVAYDRAAKVRLGVPDEVLEAHGLVSPETAVAMAETARDLFGATFGIGTTGAAGPEPLEGVPPGTVFVAVVGPGGEEWRQLSMRGPAGEVKCLAAEEALVILVSRICGG